MIILCSPCVWLLKAWRAHLRLRGIRHLEVAHGCAGTSPYTCFDHLDAVLQAAICDYDRYLDDDVGADVQPYGSIPSFPKL